MVRIIGWLGFIFGAFVLSLLPGAVWAGLLTANLKTGVETPWSVPAALVLLWLAWRFLGGEGPWKPSEARRAYRRALPVSAPVWGWALLANAFALAALVGLWIGLRHLVKIPGNPLPDFSHYPLPVLVAVLACAALVGAVGEEVGLRGYLQGRLERGLPGSLAILLTALIAAPGHALTQGFVWPTLLFYLLADITYGLTARLTGSIVPGIIAHTCGLFVFFFAVWPADACRVLLPWTDSGILSLAALAVIAGALAVWSFMRLGGLVRPPRTPASAR